MQDFIIKRRNKIVLTKFPLIFGIAGVARCGKDTLGKHLILKLNKNSLSCINISFASALKTDLDSFLKEKLKISAFTENNSEYYALNYYIAAAIS